MSYSRDLYLAQRDGRPPTLVTNGSAPGDSGVSTFKLRFEGGLHVRVTPQEHLFWFQLSDVRMQCRRAGRFILEENARAGSLAICPAGIDCSGDASQSTGALVVSIRPSRLALAAAENASLEAQLMERALDDDKALFELARMLAIESVAAYPSGPLFWNDVASSFIDRVVARHSLESNARKPQRLSQATLNRIRDYIAAHLEASIDVSSLADIAHCSPSHFSRVFAQSVGVTPHRYVVQQRLQHAVMLLREGRSCLADIAARTGFADQSHLSRWVRRVYGIPPSRLKP